MNMVRLAVIVALLSMGAACTSVPKAPTLNGSGRVPVNSPPVVDLQACRSELNNTKIMLTEATRLADSANSALAQGSGHCATPRAAPSAIPVPTPPAQPAAVAGESQTPVDSSNSVVFTLLFPFASSMVNLTDEAAISLSATARGAQRIIVSGRTDGAVATPRDERVAKARAEAVREYLIAQGVPASVIRVNYQSAADYAADNNTEQGKALNRRAEVEVYTQLPTRILLAQRGE